MNSYRNNDQTTLKTDDGNKASLKNDNREQSGREEEKGKDHCCFKWLVCVQIEMIDFKIL